MLSPPSTYPELPGFTPLRRRQQIQLPESPEPKAPVPWTTARCNRLLRPLTSRIALLRKHQEHQALRTPYSFSRPSTEIDPSITPPEIEQASQDLEWAGDGRPRKRLKRTYAAKSRLVATRRKDGSDDTIPIPSLKIDLDRAISEARQSDDSQRPEHLSTDGFSNPDMSQAAPTKWLRRNTLQAQSRNTFRRLAKSIRPGEWTSIDGLYSGLDALLKASAPSKAPPSRGPRSLFATCLRNIPVCIAREQALLEDRTAETDFAMATEMYEDLESFGSATGSGWKPLRDVVRAHGISILGNGITEGSINADVARGLIILCLQHSAFAEAHTLCADLLRLLRPLGKPKTATARLFGLDSPLCLQTLHDVSVRSGHWGFLYHQTTLLLQSGRLPVEWLASPDMVGCWNQVTTSIIREDEYSTNAFRLLQVSMSLGYRVVAFDPSTEVHHLRLHRNTGFELVNDGASESVSSHAQLSQHAEDDDASKSCSALTETLSDLVTFLATVATLRCWPTEDTHTSNLALTCLLVLVEDVRQFQAIARISGHQLHPTIGFIRASLPLVGHMILPDQEPVASRYVTEDWPPQQASVRADNLDIQSNLLFSMASCLSRATSTPAFSHLQRMIQQLQRTATPGELFLRSLVTEAASKFAQRSGQAEHLDWAQEVDKAVGDIAPTRSVPLTPARKQAACTAATERAYRWEDAICEWIARTPADRNCSKVAVTFDDFSATEASSDLEEPIFKPLIRLCDISPYARKLDVSQHLPPASTSSGAPKHRRKTAEPVQRMHGAKLIKPSGLASIWHRPSDASHEYGKAPHPTFHPLAEDEIDDRDPIASTEERKPETLPPSSKPMSNGDDDDELAWTTESTRKRPPKSANERSRMPGLKAHPVATSRLRGSRQRQHLVASGGESESDLDF